MLHNSRDRLHLNKWRLRRRTSRLLEQTLDQKTFNKWLAAARSSKNSQQVDLPSSQIPSPMSLITPDSPQLFVVIDTCSVVKYRLEFMDYVTDLKLTFSDKRSPIKFLISLTVLEELDKCNRPIKRQGRLESQSKTPSNVSTIETDVSEVIRATETGTGTSCSNANQQPPRMFMRFLEEEMRMSNILIGELDPLKTVKLEENFETLTKDDRILECCLRSRKFISTHNPHEDTKVVLVTEDNLFKSKSTTFLMPSFRWAEFRLKYKNFGLAHYVPTPLLPMVARNNISDINIHKKHQRKLTALRQTRLSDVIKQTFSNTGSNIEDDSVVFVEEIINVK